MKVSIITVTYNNVRTIEDTIESVLNQNYFANMEYIIIDGGSVDGTYYIINKYKDKINKIISEKDGGIYDAMNKGIKLADGDIVGILNSDDVYASNDVIEAVVNGFVKTSSDCVWGDLVCVDERDLTKIVRNWRSSSYEEGNFQKGWHPPHPAFFVKKNIYEKYGLFRTDLSTWADYELMLRFLVKNKITSSYIHKVLVKMREGGESNRSYWHQIKANFGCYMAFKINGLKASPFLIIKKPLFKLNQFFKN